MNLIQHSIRKFLRRKSFPGQYRLFGIFFKKGILNAGLVTTKPLEGNFVVEGDTRTWIGANIVYNGDYEPETKRIFKQLVTSGNTVLDIGANIGFHSLYLSELVGEKGKVIAIEPVKSNFQALRSNIALNKFVNIIPVEIAFSDQTGSTGIYADPASDNPGAYSLHQRGDMLIDTIKGDELLAGLAIDQLDLIKIDVEGYEFPALKGLEKTLEHFSPTIIFEYDSNYQSRSGNQTTLFTFLEKLGYRFFRISHKGLAPFDYSACIRSAQLCAINDQQDND